MLRNLYAPSDFVSTDANPSIPPEAKLDIIAKSPVEVSHSLFGGRVIDEEFWVSLPFVAGGGFSYGLGGDHANRLFTDYVNVGDKELYGHRIGSRLLRAAIRYGVEKEPAVEVFSTGWARLGLVNTTINVLGIENVAFYKGGKRYGWEGDRPLEQVFDDAPPVENKPYLVYGIEAKIDRDLAMSWERPVST